LIIPELLVFLSEEEMAAYKKKGTKIRFCAGNQHELFEPFFSPFSLRQREKGLCKGANKGLYKPKDAFKYGLYSTRGDGNKMLLFGSGPRGRRFKSCRSDQ